MDKYSGMNKVPVRLSIKKVPKSKPRRRSRAAFVFAGFALTAALAAVYAALKVYDAALFEIISVLTGGRFV